MCAVCVEYGKGTITKKEALSALQEMIDTTPQATGDEVKHFVGVWYDLQSEEDESDA